MQQGYGEGFRHWATTQNLKEMSKTLIYLQERGMDDYEILTEKAAAASRRFNDTSDRLKAIDARLGEISDLQKHIGAYSKTQEVYKQYREGGWSKKFYAAHEGDIILHRAAKKHFDSLGLKKLPTMNTLKQEYAKLKSEQGKLYQSYKRERAEMIELQTAKMNVDRLFGTPAHKDKSRENAGPEL